MDIAKKVPRRNEAKRGAPHSMYGGCTSSIPHPAFLWGSPLAIPQFRRFDLRGRPWLAQNTLAWNESRTQRCQADPEDLPATQHAIRITRRSLTSVSEWSVTWMSRGHRIEHRVGASPRQRRLEIEAECAQPRWRARASEHPTPRQTSMPSVSAANA